MISEKEVQLYLRLMRCIDNKQHGCEDENDVQRALGALYQEWVNNGSWYEI